MADPMTRARSVTTVPTIAVPTAAGTGWTAGWVRDDDGLRGLRADWDELHGRCADPTPFGSHAWNRAWWTHYGEPGALRVGWLRRDGRLEALAPLMLVRRSGMRVLTALGGEQSDYTDVLVDREHAEQATARLAALLAAGRGWQVLDLPQVPPGGAAGRLAGHWPGRATRIDGAACLHLPVRGIDELLATLPTRTRGTLRRKLRIIDRVGVAGRDAPADRLGESVGELLRLHERQWAGRDGNPEHLTARFRGFLTDAAAGLGPSGALRVREYRLDGELLAAELLLCGPRSVGGYLTGVAPELRSTVDTASLMLRANLAVVADTGAAELDLLRGREDYKLRWRPTAVVNHRLLLRRGRRPGRGDLYTLASAGRVRAARLLREEHPELHAALRTLSTRGPVAAVRVLRGSRAGA
jgi:CelD/BcsL family acetyltransferase involved in cellulose biosynthesis